MKGEEKCQPTCPSCSWWTVSQVWEVVQWAPGNVLYCDCNICTWDIIILDANLRTNKVGSWVSKITKQNQIGGNREGRNVCFGKSDEFIMIDTTCTYKHHVISSIVYLNIVRQVITFDGHNVSFLSKNHATGYEAGLIEISHCMQESWGTHTLESNCGLWPPF